MARFRFIFAAIVLALAGALLSPPAPAQTLATPLNNASSALASAHAIGSGTLALRAGTGVRFGSTFPIRVTAIRRATMRGGAIDPDVPTVFTIFLVSGRTVDTLTGCTAIEGTADNTYALNDPVVQTITAGALSDIHTALANRVAKAGDETVAGVKTFSSPIAGSVTGSAATITGSVNQSQVTNLTTDLAAKAADSAVVHLTPAETITGSKTFAGGIIANGGGGLATNQAFGSGALGANTTGAVNTALGYNAMASNTVGAVNAAFGYRALATSTNGNNTLAIGPVALELASSASNSVAVGAYALNAIGTAGDNTAIGYRADVAKASGIQTTAIGSGTSTANLNTATAIGYGATNTASNQVMLGGSGTTVAMNGQLDLLALSSTSAVRTQASVVPGWDVATDASRKGRVDLVVSNENLGQERKGLRVVHAGDATGARVFLSAPPTPVVDSQIPAGFYGLSLDEATGNITFRARYSDGTTLGGGIIPLAQPRGNQVVLTGDSTAVPSATQTAQIGSLVRIQFSPGWLEYACVLSNGKIRYGRNDGQGGNTTSQMVSRIAGTMAYKPGLFGLLGGVNDIGTLYDLDGGANDIPEATTRTNVAAIFDANYRAHARGFICTICPWDLHPDDVIRYNAWIRYYGESVGLIVLDFHSLLADPANGHYAATLSSDGLHPTSTAAIKLMAGEAATKLPATLPAWQAPLCSTGAATSVYLLTNGLMTDGNADGVPDSWTLAGAATSTSAVASAAPVPGNWWVWTQTAGTGKTLSQTIASVTPGHRLAVLGQIQTTAEAGALIYSVSLSYKDGGGAAVANAEITPIYTWPFDIASTGLYYGEAVVPATAASAVMTLSTAGGTGTLKIGRATVIDMTALGVDSL